MEISLSELGKNIPLKRFYCFVCILMLILIPLSYQSLAIEARDIWLAWNESIKNMSSSELPDGLTPEDKLLHVCGCYFLGEGREMLGYIAECLDLMGRTAPDFREMQFAKVGTTLC
jgi:hypothetical protein